VLKRSRSLRSRFEGENEKEEVRITQDYGSVIDPWNGNRGGGAKRTTNVRKKNVLPKAERGAQSGRTNPGPFSRFRVRGESEQMIRREKQRANQ